MKVCVLICTYGEEVWRRLGHDMALGVYSSQEDFDPSRVEPYRHHEPEGTLASTRNNAVRLCAGDWVCLVDADDSLAPGYLAAMRKVMHAYNLWRPADLRANPLLLVPSVQYVDADGNCQGEPRIPDWEWSLINLNCAVIGTLIPRALFLELGGFREALADGTPLSSLEDWDFFLRAVKAGARMVPVPDAVYCAQAGHRRNADQSPYHAIRREHMPGFDWANVGAYKAGL